MALSSTRRTGLVDQVIEQLRAAVRQGEWAIGERIPTEVELAATLGVGRNTVREAVRALAHSGLLEVRQGDGTYVRATSEVSGALRRLCGSRLREALQVRRILEVEAARLAAAERTDDDLERLRALLDERDRLWSRGDLDAFARADVEFHIAMVEASHNSVLGELYRGLTELVTASIATTSQADEHEPHPVDHSGIVTAIAERDPQGAADHTLAFLDELIARNPASDG
ncbi:FadR/GntR family transcriptional regulator [Saccharomonospora xinjiangensis]|uniref:FadR/GntR family transcriptional regulator n=1 Tax=Saccharomonospora xinjiangensis TaxID=75294 RepID=UPI0010C2569F|nr:FadR/GntR family transcriptional regulator [Saccharomonospora xinjiangensis]QBQ59468.1 Pyruvate dehydrogenase complex repressor [Saccharomonospora xinjiangensis]